MIQNPQLNQAFVVEAHFRSSWVYRNLENDYDATVPNQNLCANTNPRPIVFKKRHEKSTRISQQMIGDLKRAQEESKPYVECTVYSCDNYIRYELTEKGTPVGWLK